jgi:ferredoxin
MVLEAAQLIYFSPTRTTQHVLEAIGQGTGLPLAAPRDVTRPDEATRTVAPSPDVLTLIGVPVYAGRVPGPAASRLRRVDGNGSPAAMVVVYGNRAYEDALLELTDLVVAQGFVPVAAGAFIGEHSFSSAATPIAVGRPDAADLARAMRFGEAIRDKLENLEGGGNLPGLTVPGNVPYRQRPAPLQVAPISREDVCVRCEQCAQVCPMGAIRLAEAVETRQEDCLHCFACVKACPTGARILEHPGLLEIARRLAVTCAARQEPEVFL